MAKMLKCANCRFRKNYDHNPASWLGRLWRWHTGWCPGWKLYLKSLPESERLELAEKCGIDGRIAGK